MDPYVIAICAHMERFAHVNPDKVYVVNRSFICKIEAGERARAIRTARNCAKKYGVKYRIAEDAPKC